MQHKLFRLEVAGHTSVLSSSEEGVKAEEECLVTLHLQSRSRELGILVPSLFSPFMSPVPRPLDSCPHLGYIFLR